MRVRTVIALLLLTLYPATAHAWWWDYFDGLSGPGPFQADQHYPSFEVTFSPETFLKDPVHSLLDDPSREKKWSVAFRLVGMNNDDHLQMFENQPLDRRHVHLTTVDISAMYRVNKVLDLGVGLSILKFSGQEDEPFRFNPIYRVGPIGKMTVTPFGAFLSSDDREDNLRRVFWLLRAPKFFLDVTIIKGFEAAEFGNPAGDLSTSHETKVRAGFLVDGSSLFCAIKGCSKR